MGCQLCIGGGGGGGGSGGGHSGGSGHSGDSGGGVGGGGIDVEGMSIAYRKEGHTGHHMVAQVVPSMQIWNSSK